MRLQWYFRNGRNWKSYRYFLIPLPHLLKNKKRNWGAVFRSLPWIPAAWVWRRPDILEQSSPSPGASCSPGERKKDLFKGDFFQYFIQHCFICSPPDSTVSNDAGIEPRTVATTALAVRRSKHTAKSHPKTAKSHPLRLNLIHSKLNLIHFG